MITSEQDQIVNDIFNIENRIEYLINKKNKSVVEFFQLQELKNQLFELKNIKRSR